MAERDVIGPWYLEPSAERWTPPSATVTRYLMYSDEATSLLRNERERVADCSFFKSDYDYYWMMCKQDGVSRLWEVHRGIFTLNCLINPHNRYSKTSNAASEIPWMNQPSTELSIGKQYFFTMLKRRGIMIQHPSCNYYHIFTAILIFYCFNCFYVVKSNMRLKLSLYVNRLFHLSIDKVLDNKTGVQRKLHGPRYSRVTCSM